MGYSVSDKLDHMVYGYKKEPECLRFVSETLAEWILEYEGIGDLYLDDIEDEYPELGSDAARFKEKLEIWKEWLEERADKDAECSSNASDRGRDDRAEEYECRSDELRSASEAYDVDNDTIECLIGNIDECVEYINDASGRVIPD